MAFEVPDFQTPFQIQQKMENTAADTGFKQAQAAHLATEDLKTKAALAQQQARADAWKGFNPDAVSSSGSSSPFSLGNAKPSGQIKRGEDGGFYVDMDSNPQMTDLTNLSPAVNQAGIVSQFAKEHQIARAVLQTEIRGGDPDAITKAIKDEREAYFKKAVEEGKFYELQLKDFNQLRTELASVATSPDRAAAMAQVVNGAMGRYGREVIMQALKKNNLIAPNGKLIDNPFAIQTLQNSLLDAAEKVKDQRKQIDQDMEKRKQDEEEKERKIKHAESDRTYFLEKNKYTLSVDEFKQKTQQDARRNAENINKQLDAIVPAEKITDVNTSRQLINSIIAPFTEKGRLKENAWETMGNANQDVLLTRWQTLRDQSSRLAGDNISKQDAKELVGLQDKVAKYLTTVGGATPYLNNDSLEEVVRSMNQMAKITNRVAVMESLKAGEKALRDGANPNYMTFRGDLAQFAKDHPGTVERQTGVQDGKKIDVIWIKDPITGKRVGYPMENAYSQLD